MFTIKYTMNYYWLRICTIGLLISLLLPSGSVFAQGHQPPTASNDPRTFADNPYWVRQAGNLHAENLRNESNRSAAPVIADAPSLGLATTSELVGSNSIVNGDFEQGQNVGWSETSSHGYDVVVPYTPDPEIIPHSGTWIAWLGDDNNEKTTISQSNITIPQHGYLQLWYWSGSNDTCGHDYAKIKFNGNVVNTLNLCSDTNTYGWKSLIYENALYYGQTVTITIEVTTNGSTPSGLLIDDVSIQSPIVYTISGNVGVAGATLTYTDGSSTFTTADGSGNYSIAVPAGWSGTIEPHKIGYAFTPTYKSYTNLQSDQPGQDFVAAVCPTCADRETVGVFRPTNGALYLKNSNITGFADVQINYGIGGDYPITGDWNGDGVDTIGIYRNGSFYLRNSNTIGFADLTFAYGMPGDQPVAGDWNGDGVDTIGIYRNGVFYLRNSNTAGMPELIFALGVPGDVGIAGDWTGKGFDTTGVFRPSNGALYLKNTNATGFADVQINYGIGGDRPVTGDWNNDGTDTIGVYRNGSFYLRNSNTIGYADIVFALGVPGDMPIAGNWDGKP